MSSCGTSATFESATETFTITTAGAPLFAETRVTLTDPDGDDVRVIAAPDDPVRWSKITVTVPLWPNRAGTYTLTVTIGLLSPCVDVSEHRIRPDTSTAAFRISPDPAMLGDVLDMVAERDGYAFPASPASVELVGHDVMGRETSRVPLTAVTVLEERHRLSAVLPTDISVDELTAYVVEIDRDRSQRGSLRLVPVDVGPGVDDIHIELWMTGFTANKETHDALGVFGSPGDEVALQYLEFLLDGAGAFSLRSSRTIPPDGSSWDDVEEGNPVDAEHLLSSVPLSPVAATVVGVPVLWERDGSPDIELTGGLTDAGLKLDEAVVAELTRVVASAAQGVDVNSHRVDLEGLQYYRPAGWWPVGRKGDRPIGFTNEREVVIDGAPAKRQVMTPAAIVISPALATRLQAGSVDLEPIIFEEGSELGSSRYELRLQLRLGDGGGLAPVRMVAPLKSINPLGHDVNRNDGPGEYILLVNGTDEPMDLSGWRIQDLAGNSVDIPELSFLPPGGELRVYTGPGAPSPGEVHIGRDAPYLTNTGDLLMLLDAGGRSVHTLRTPAE